MSSLEESRWVDEEPYEMVDFSPAVRNVRQEKSAFLGAFKSELFKGELKPLMNTFLPIYLVRRGSRVHQ